MTRFFFLSGLSVVSLIVGLGVLAIVDHARDRLGMRRRQRARR